MVRGESVAFDRIADSYDATRGGLERGQRIGAGVAPWLRPGPVVEVGVGTGVVARELVACGHPVVGVDLSAPMLARAHARLGPCVAVGDGYRLPLRPRSVPNVLSVWVTQLVPDLAGFLAALGRPWRPVGGWSSCRRPAARPAATRSSGSSPRCTRRLRPKRDRPDQLVALADGAGLRLVEGATTGNGVWHTSPNEQANEIEARSWSSLWDVPDDVWDEVVAPAVATLRALPQPDRPRDRTGHFDVVVFEPA